MEDVVVLGRYCGRVCRSHLVFLTGLNEKSRFLTWGRPFSDNEGQTGVPQKSPVVVKYRIRVQQKRMK
jgi:uncharacterized protein YciI